MKKILFVVLGLLTSGILQAQTKVFKEVGQDISTQFKAIVQDNTLVGYLTFTKLEKASADSFNYKISIMDENLNEIGTVNFRQANLFLQSVSFEQNVISLGYLKSPFVGLISGREARRTSATNDILLQFISLNGKIINTYTKPVTIMATAVATGAFSMKETGDIKHHIQISNIANTGFCVFYGDNEKSELLLFDTKGSLVHEKKVSADVPEFVLQTSGQNIYLLAKKDGSVNSGNIAYELEGGYTLYMYNTAEPGAEYKYSLVDQHGNNLKVLSFDNDPVTGRAFLAGCVINNSRRKDFMSARDYSKGPYLGIFTLDLGKTDKDVKANYSYWDKGTIAGLTEDGLFTDKEFYVKYHTAFRDYNGNTVFAGAALAEKKFLGAAKYKMADGVFVRQDATGSLKLDNNITCDETRYFAPFGPLVLNDKKAFYKIVNADTKTQYMIIDDFENTYIYNINAKKIIKTIPHKDGRIKTHVYPAKEGHMMVSEYDTKEKSTKLSIEALQ